MKMNSGATMNSFSVPRVKALLASTMRLLGPRNTTVRMMAVNPMANPAGMPVNISTSNRPTISAAPRYQGRIIAPCKPSLDFQKLGSAYVGALLILHGKRAGRRQPGIQHDEQVRDHRQAHTDYQHQ